MTKDSIQRLREPAAWVLVGAALASIVGGLLGLLLGTQQIFGGAPFTLNAGNVRDAFLSPLISALFVVAVLLATHVGERLPRARTLVMVALGGLGAAGLFGFVCWLAALGSPLTATGSKLHNLLYGAGELAVLGMAGYFTMTVFRGLPAPPKAPKPPKPGAQQQQAYQIYPGYPQQPGGHGQQQAYPGWPAPQPGQPGHQGQPGQPGQPGHQGQPGQPGQYGDYAQGGQPYPPGSAPGYAPYPASHSDTHPPQPHAQPQHTDTHPPQPPGHYPGGPAVMPEFGGAGEAGRPPGPAAGGSGPAEAEDNAGMWTRVHGDTGDVNGADPAPTMVGEPVMPEGDAAGPGHGGPDHSDGDRPHPPLPPQPPPHPPAQPGAPEWPPDSR